MHINGFTPNMVNEKSPKSLLPPLEYAKMRTLAESISRDIIRGTPNVKWGCILGVCECNLLDMLSSLLKNFHICNHFAFTR